METNYILYLFLQKILFYEEAIFNKIKSHIFYPFQNRRELNQAVSLYVDEETRDHAIKHYNDIFMGY